MAYQPNVPTGLVNLNVDYANIQGNFQQLDTTFGVDHVTYSNVSAQNGYHTSIHFNPVSTTATNPPNNQPPVVPAAIAGFGQLLNAEVNDGPGPADTNLYFLTGLGNLIQLTRSFPPQANTNGYTFLPGGLILQWGFRSVTSGSWPSGNQNLVFASQSPANIVFPNACFIVTTNFTGSSGSSGSIGIVSKSQNGFVWNFGGSSSSQFNGFYWIAIGN